MGPTEKEIMEYLLSQQKARGPLGDVIDPEGIGSPEVPLDQLPEDITLPPEQNEDITQRQTINELSNTIPPDISNMSPEIYPTAGVLGEAESVGADETHTMKDGTVHPGRNHEAYLDMIRALLKNQEIEGVELVGADLRGTRLGRGQY